MPSIDEMMQEANWAPADLELIVVGVGPGGFTGLRSGVVTARTLAHMLELPLVPISTFECIAEAVQLPAAIVLSAGRQGFYAAAYEPGELFAQEKLAAAYVEARDLKALLLQYPRTLADQKAYRQLTAGAEIDCLPVAEFKNMAGAQLELAQRKLSCKVSGPCACLAELRSLFPWQAVVPLYLKAPSVTVKRSYVNQNAPDDARGSP